jgi:hypothetical protein
MGAIVQRFRFRDTRCCCRARTANHCRLRTVSGCQGPRACSQMVEARWKERLRFPAFPLLVVESRQIVQAQSRLGMHPSQLLLSYHQRSLQQWLRLCVLPLSPARLFRLKAVLGCLSPNSCFISSARTYKDSASPYFPCIKADIIEKACCSQRLLSNRVFG